MLTEAPPPSDKQQTLLPIVLRRGKRSGARPQIHMEIGGICGAAPLLLDQYPGVSFRKELADAVLLFRLIQRCQEVKTDSSAEKNDNNQFIKAAKWQ